MVSNLVSNAGHTPASAIAPLGDTVYVPDPRLGNVLRENEIKKAVADR